MLDLFSTIDVLTVQETNRKAELEAIIERGEQTFIEVGFALMEIRDKRLYRNEYPTFEEYCREKRGWGRRHAYRLIDAAAVVGNVSNWTQIQAPATESQARPLTTLSPELQPVAWQEAVDTAPNGKVTAAHVQAVVDRMQSKTSRYCPYCGTSYEALVPEHGVTRCPACNQQHLYSGPRDTEKYGPYRQPEPSKERANQAMGATVYSHNSLDYYTPRYVTDAAREVMGGIDLDPASCEMAQAWIEARKYYTIADDGLAQPWSGRVWLNPPYSYTDGRSNQDLWSERLVTEYLQGEVTEGLLLVKAALGYKWFERLWDTWPVCFMRDRLSFVMPDGTDDGQSKQATAIFYIGGNVSKFVDVFRKFGRVILPEDQKYG